MNLRPLVPLLALFAVACNQEPTPEKPPVPKTDTPPKSQLPPGVQNDINALNKAKQANETIQKGAEERDQAIRQQTGQ